MSDSNKYYNAVKIKITDEYKVHWLNYIREIFLSEYETLKNNPNIQLESFSEQELSHQFRGHFVKKLADLTEKHYSNWDLNNRFRYFKMFSMHLRQDFNSLTYKQQITNILLKHNFDIVNSNDAIREDLIEMNLYPTKQELMNIIRNKDNFNYRLYSSEVSPLHTASVSASLLQNYYKNTRNIPLDFTLGQDKQTIIHSDEKQPMFNINFNGNWIKFDFREQVNKLEYIQKKINNPNFVRFCKPKFVLLENENELKNANWYCILAIEFKKSLDNNVSNNHLIAGVDIGQVKPYSAVILSSHNKSSNNNSLFYQLNSKELTCSKETKQINIKLNRVKEHLSSIYQKINVYENIIKNNKNSQFTAHIMKKLEERNREKRELRRKRKELQKRKSYLAVRDLMKQLNFYNVKKVNIERLNWVENTGGSWDFSQQQEILIRKAMEHGIKVNKVYAANTSKENPFTKKRLLGEADRKTRRVSFKGKKYEIDRDVLGAINIALRKRSKNKIESVDVAKNTDTDKDKNNKDKNEIDVTTKNKQAKAKPRAKPKPKPKLKNTLIFNQRKLKNLIKQYSNSTEVST